MKKSRILALLLCAVMLLSLFPAAAFASEEDTETIVETSAEEPAPVEEPAFLG